LPGSWRLRADEVLSLALGALLVTVRDNKMADITVKGYVNHPKTEKVGERTISKFSLAESYKDKKTGKKSYGFYNVTDWNNPLPPKDGSYITLTGRLMLRGYEKDGVKKTSIDITANTIEVAPPKDGTAAATEAPKEKEDAKPDSFSF
jgi:single-stranded DNA-binding protein